VNGEEQLSVATDFRYSGEYWYKEGVHEVIFKMGI